MDVKEFLFSKIKEHGFSVIFSIVIIIIAIFALKITRKAIKKAFEKINKKDSTSYKLAQRGAKIGIVFTAIFLILSKFNIPLNALFTLVSSSLVAFGLSLSNFFSNVAKSLQVSLMRPYSVGDLIEIDSKKGRVKKIDYMHTYIVNEEHGLIMVPNALVADKSIINYSRREKAMEVIEDSKKETEKEIKKEDNEKNAKENSKQDSKNSDEKN